MQSESPKSTDWPGWIAAWLLVAAGYGASLYRARRESTPDGFRRHVGALIVGFLLLDAIASWAAAGRLAGLAVLALLIPTRVASRQAPMT